jgi:hypothetical protein
MYAEEVGSATIPARLLHTLGVQTCLRPKNKKLLTLLQTRVFQGELAASSASSEQEVKE